MANAGMENINVTFIYPKIPRSVEKSTFETIRHSMWVIWQHFGNAGPNINPGIIPHPCWHRFCNANKTGKSNNYTISIQHTSHRNHESM
eukprot:4402324-Ditylum_brightwellii.AAC.1